jgi:hypothetical protein
MTLVDGKAHGEGTPEFSHDAVLDGYWEFFHDDDCGAVLEHWSI